MTRRTSDDRCKNNKSGFTIIEVMIVLTIAGLILLIVFLAVPTMQRNARNVQRKNDAGKIAAAIGSFIVNNGGQLPIHLSDDGSTGTITFQAVYGTDANTESAALSYYKTSGSQAGGGSYNDGEIYLGVLSAGETTTPVFGALNFPDYIDTESVCIKVGEDCSPIYDPRTVAIWYAVETADGKGAVQCIEAS